MSRGFNKSAKRTQKSQLSEQDETASKGVNYCKKCIKRKERKNNKNLQPKWDSPPTMVIFYWLWILSVIYAPYVYITLFENVRIVAKFSLIIAISYDIAYFSVITVRRLITPVLSPQMGYERVDPYLKEAIQVWCLFESLRDAKTKRGMIAAITQYMQAHVKESLLLYTYRQLTRADYVSDWTSDDGTARIEEMLDSVFDPKSIIDDENGLTVLDIQDGDVNPKSISWHEAMDGAFQNWKEFRHSKMASRFTHLINVIVSAGMCATADLTFKIGNVSLFSPIISKRQVASADVFEAFYEAVAGFMKGGWRVFQTGDVSSFFMEDDKISEFEDLYNKIRSWHGYALAGNLREYAKIDENEYELLLKNALDKGDVLLKSINRSQTFERKYISDRMDKLRDNETEFTQLRTRGGLRIAPFAVCLFGRSGCGKSCLTNLTVNAGLIYNDLSAEKDRIATWADNDKFASSIRSHCNAIIFDDFANTKEDFMDFSPAYRLIQVINNIRYLAPMADVFLKGKVSLNPYFCVVSTNVEHLNAWKYSNEPESVLRRLYHVKVTPKPEFCTKGILDKKKIEARFGKTPCPDAWYLDIRYYDAQNSRHVDLAAMKPVEFEGKPMAQVSVKEYLRWLQVSSKEHFEDEKKYLDNQSALPTKCENCSMLYCDCKLDERPTGCIRELKHDTVLEPHSGQWESYSNRRGKYFSIQADTIKMYFETASTSAVLLADRICSTWERVDFLPERWICHPNILKIGLIFWREDIRHSLISGNSALLITMLFCMWRLPSLSIIWLFGCISLMYWFTCATVQTYRYMIRDRILELKDVVKTYTNQWQFKYALVGLGAIGLILATMRSRYTKLDTHTGLDPTSIDEINQRNDKTNPWLVAETVSLPMSEPSKTTTSANLAASMKTNLIGIVSDKNKTTLGFYICSNFLIVPTHFINEHGDRDISIRCYKTVENKVGSYFRDKLSKSFCINIPQTDFSLCFVTSGGSMKDFRKFLPTGSTLCRSPALLVTRGIMDNSLQAIPTLFKGSSRVAHTQTVFMGSYYELPVDTQSGMCMSPIISDMKGSTIMGFHLGGKGRLGGCGTLTLDQANLAISELASVDGVVLSASSGMLNPNMGDFPSETFGVSILKDDNIHPKSAVNFLTTGACIDVYGSTTGKASPVSNVCPTIISKAVEEEFGVPQKWGPPKMKGKGRYPYQATLVHAATPSLPIGSVLSKSVRSIKDLTTDLKERIPELFHTSPLSRVATVSGMIGVKFIDPMNFSSSPGFPLSGSKHPLIIDLDPETYPDIGKPRTFVPEVWGEFDKIVSILREGKRCYVIWKSCLKDEATKLTKDKVRVFQSAPLVLQLLIRMYFLPIVRIIQMNPILYECAVGVNAEGLEWEELWNAAMSKGKDRVLAGDYSKYDIRMPAQVTIAAFDVLIDIAEKCENYSTEDIQLMQMLVHEVVYPVMAYNGDLIQLFGTNPSGQNLTVIINSLVNSLLLRSCFFTLYPQYNFKEHCSFLTYGDDVIGTVSSFCEEFTHITYATWLAEHDMKFTMPDKESEPTHYMKESDVDFLKRKCEFNEDLGRQVGLLSEDSIFKRLHAHLLSKELSLPMHSAQNIESSLHDWFYYGREVFEDRRDKLLKVAQKCDIEHLCPGLKVSYDKRVNHWRHKYLGEELEEDVDMEILDVQCGSMFVETVDFRDHCIGSVFERKFWWEDYVLLSGIVIMPILWYLIAAGKVIAKWGRPTSLWTIYILLTVDFRLSAILYQLVAIYFVAHIGTLCYHGWSLYKSFMVSLITGSW